MVDYKVVIENNTNAGALYRGLLTDTLYDPFGGVMYARSWNLETVAPADLITLSYSIEFGTSTKPGIYRNVARVTGMSNHPVIGNQFEPVEASSIVEFTEAGKVLGTSTVAVADEVDCKPLITSFMSRSRKNNSAEVVKLQTFLNAYQSANLPTTGYYGPMTTAAVSVFQQKYAAEVLTPLGIKAPTGGVYSMTQNKINQLACGGKTPIVVTAPAPQVAAAVAVHSAVPSAPKPKPEPKTPKSVLQSGAFLAPLATDVEQAPTPPQKAGWFSMLKSLFGGN